MWLIHIHGASAAKTDGGKPITIQANHGRQFSCISCWKPAALSFVATIGLLLFTEGGNCHTIANLSEL
jgi:hypothetical protein